MFDQVDPRLFWAVFTLAWLAASWLVLWIFSKWVDAGNPRKTRFEQRDHVAERRRALERRGFKSRIGAR